MHPLSLPLYSLHAQQYWGKRDTKLILPTNSSLSVTLSQDDLRSTTTIRASETFSKDRLWLNGNEQTEGVNEGRTGACIREMKKLRAEAESKDSSLPVGQAGEQGRRMSASG